MHTSRNEQTRIADVKAARAPGLPHHAWRDAMVQLNRRLPSVREQPMLAAVVILPGVPAPYWPVFAVAHHMDRPCLAITLGRHEACPVALPAGSLRQVTVMGWPDGSLWALDLNTATGLEVEGVLAQRIQAASGAMLFGAGGAWVAAVVVQRSAVATEIPPPSWPNALSTNPLATPSLDGSEEGPQRNPSEGSFVSYVNRLQKKPSPRELGAWAISTSPVFRASDGTYRDGQGAIAHPGAWGVLTLQPGDLARGLLLGRYERCANARLTRCWDGVSRVHALLVSRGPQLLVVDVGSHNGTGLRRAGRPDLSLNAATPVAEWTPGDQLLLGELLELDLKVAGDA